ncbi:MAG: TraB/GumN family protein [Steroidobacteraceae bacterium]
MRTHTLNFLLAALLLTGPAHATEGPRLWRLQGANNAVYLFGSMHLLRPGDFRVEGALASAYQDAETLLLEVDTNGLTQASAESITLQRALDEKGRAEPWFEALNVTTASLNQVGFTVESGVEAQLQRLARADGKRLGGLETLDEQLATLDSLSPEVQQELLQKSLEDAHRPLPELEAFVAAWKAGNDAYLTEQLNEEFVEHPEVYRALIVERNQRWARRIVELLEEHDDYLVVVGALHLVGEDSLQSLLEADGYRTEGLR